MLTRAKVNIIAATIAIAAAWGQLYAQGAAGVASQSPADGITSKQVSTAVEKGIAYLRQKQLRDGSWGEYNGYPGGTTALAMLAMLNAGVDPGDPAITTGMEYLSGVKNTSTYVTSLKCQVFSAYLQIKGVTINDQKYQLARTQVSEAATWLINNQLSQKSAAGMWSYGTGGGGGDNSNTQFALLGLHEAAKVGFPVPAKNWQASVNHYKNTQNADGGWGYRFHENSYGAMTAAGVASAVICGQRLNIGGEKKFVNGAYPDCGKYLQNAMVAAGVKWLGDNFSATKVTSTWHYYYLYAVERVGMIAGTQYLGKHDWYRQGAAWLIEKQNSNGSWPGETIDTSFAILFLAKGNRPVLIQKLQWSDDPSKWNRNIHDLENLTNFIGEKFGKATTWQSIKLSASAEQLQSAPLLLITGHEFPTFTPQEKERIKQYVAGGGTLLCEACCGSEQFASGFRAFARELWPEQVLRPLKVDSDPVFSCYFKINDSNSLEGLDAGCRTSVFFSPKAMSCLWELQTIPEYSKNAFELGTNIAAYATGREQLGGRLDTVYIPPSATKEETEIPRGAVRIARLIHSGDYNTDPNAIVNLTTMLRDKAGMNIVTKSRLVKPTDKELFDYPVVFMTGHYDFTFSDAELTALRTYLKRGGTIVADACCGKKEFDAAFRKMAGQLLPDNPLKPLAADHPIITGKPGLPLGQLKYRHILATELKSQETAVPPLEAIQIDGRCAVIYSKYDFSCALEGDKPYSCRGYQDDAGTKLAFNIFLYAISY